MSSTKDEKPVYETDARSLPAPATAPRASSPAEAAKKINPAVIIAIWIGLSSSVILYNKYTLSISHCRRAGSFTGSYHSPIFLTTWHLTFATIGVRILKRSTRLLDGLNNVQMTWDRYLRSIVPIGALFSASLIFSNMAYLTLSVSFIQMLKASMSVVVLGMSVIFGLQTPNQRTLFIVLVISLGVALASYGEIHFAMSGFICQALGIVFEAARLVSIEKLLHGMKMDPLVSLYYFAPVCAAINALLLPFYEGLDPIFLAYDALGPGILISNAMCAFALNVSVVYLIGSASSLVLTLSGVLKDILLVAFSVFVFGSIVTFPQMLGYSIALVGLVVFKTPKDKFDEFIVRARATLGR